MKNNSSLEDLQLYQNYVQLMYYTYMICKKFPLEEQGSLVSDLKIVLREGLDELILAQKSFERDERLMHLNALDGKLKVFKVLIRVSQKFRYISSHNYGAWSRKVAGVTNLLGAWVKKCLKL